MQNTKDKHFDFIKVKKNKSNRNNKKFLILGLILLTSAAITIPSLILTKMNYVKSNNIKDKNLIIKTKIDENKLLVIDNLKIKDQNKKILISNNAYKTENVSLKNDMNEKIQENVYLKTENSKITDTNNLLKIEIDNKNKANDELTLKNNELSSENEKINYEKQALELKNIELNKIKNSFIDVANNYQISIDNLKDFYLKNANYLVNDSLMEFNYKNDSRYLELKDAYTNFLNFVDENDSFENLLENGNVIATFHNDVLNYIYNLNNHFENILTKYSELNNANINKLNELNVTVLNLRNEMESLKKQIEINNTILEKNREQIALLEQNIQNLNEINENLKNNIKELKLELENKNNDYQNLLVLIENKNSDILNLKNLVKEYQENIKELELDKIANISQIEKLNSEIEIKTNEINKLKSDILSLNTQKMNLEENINNLNNQRTSFIAEIEKNKQNITFLTSRVSSLEKENENLGEQVKKLSQENDLINNLYLNSKHSYAKEIVNEKLKIIQLMIENINHFSDIWNDKGLFFANDEAKYLFKSIYDNININTLLNKTDEDFDNEIHNITGLEKEKLNNMYEILKNVYITIKDSPNISRGKYFKDKLNEHIKAYNIIIQDANNNLFKPLKEFQDTTLKKRSDRTNG
ncbi:hypothetical protein N8G13_01840 [Mycoplasma zalophi]|uniref:hypothetical protein n=1 Tax=Mycoplasma zalophi TaxID=191287 RepID=UPI0021C82272|nr:hypothetical protein [Mycoplasma zalophi]MCU4117197.1 hypothetical protein [Mycoplasma zalophi]